MSSPASGAPNARFKSRLNRVEERMGPRDKGEFSVHPDWKGAIFGKLGMLVALLVGILAVLAVRIGRFHLMGTAMISDNPDMTLVNEFGASFALGILILMILSYRGVKYHFIQFAGVAIMISMMHNAVHAAPGLFGIMFSPEWVAAVQEKTEPSSLYLRGGSIPLGPKEEKPLPPVRRGS